MKPKTTAGAADLKKLNDEELVYRFVHRHENAAIDYLFERYGHLVLGICMKYCSTAQTAREKTETIFIQLTVDLKKYHNEDFKTWLYNYVNNECLSGTKNQADMWNNTIKTGGMSFYPTDVTDGEIKLIEESMNTLNKTEQDFVSLFYIDGMNYVQIARKKQVTVAEVKQYIQSGIQNIKTKSEALRHVKL